MKRAYLINSVKTFFLLIMIGFISIVWVNRELKKGHGGFTEFAEVKEFINTSQSLIIKDVNILSTDCTQFIPNQTITLHEGIIKSINQDSISNENYKIINGTNKFLIPGLVDSHVHLKNSKNDLLLYLINGVTYIREMSGNPIHLKWKNEISNDLIGPKMFIASEKVNSKPGVSGMFESWTRNKINYSTEKAANSKIKQLYDIGFDAVKIGSFISSEMYKATVSAANKYNLPVIGHIPYSIGLDSIYKSGQCEIAHVEEITKDLIEKFGSIDAENSGDFLQYVKDQSDTIAIKLRINDIAVSTTVWLIESLPQQKFNLDSLIKEISLEYANPGLIEGTKLGKGWLPGNNSYENLDIKSNPEKRKKSKIFWKAYVDAIQIMTKSLAKNGVVVLAGTDANVPVTIPGFSLHDELESLSNCGMSNAQVLYSATVAPGEWMNSNTGKIEPGYDADLVLLSKNPLLDIEHTTSIEYVFYRNNWLTKRNIEQILNAVSNVNDESRSINISEYTE